MNNKNERLEAETKRKYWWNVFCNGVRRIQNNPKITGLYLLLCAAVVALVSLALIENRMDGVLSVFQPFAVVTYCVAGLVACVAAVLPLGYIRHSWEYYDDFTRAGIYNRALQIVCCKFYNFMVYYFCCNNKGCLFSTL